MQKLIDRTRIGTAINAMAQSKTAHWLGKKLLWLYKGLPELIVYGYAFLYMYTGYDKLKQVDIFINGNKRIPLVGQYAELIGWGIPVIEILLAVLLTIPFLKVKRIALWASVILMGIFTLYLALMLLFADTKPCNCGGVIESMDWFTHLIINLLCLGAGIFAIRNLKKLYF